MADDNEIMTADTQAENTSDTADIGQTTPTTEELIQQLTARVAALEEIVGEEEYELRYSGEQTDELLDGGTAVFRAKTAAQIRKPRCASFSDASSWLFCGRAEPDKSELFPTVSVVVKASSKRMV